LFRENMAEFTFAAFFGWHKLMESLGITLEVIMLLYLVDIMERSHIVLVWQPTAMIVCTSDHWSKSSVKRLVIALQYQPSLSSMKPNKTAPTS
jgi:hypothetical protein